MSEKTWWRLKCWMFLTDWTSEYLVAVAGVVFDFFGGSTPLLALYFEEVMDYSLQMESDFSRDMHMIL